MDSIEEEKPLVKDEQGGRPLVKNEQSCINSIKENENVKACICILICISLFILCMYPICKNWEDYIEEHYNIVNKTSCFIY